MTHVFRIQSERRLTTFQFNCKVNVPDGAQLFLDFVRHPSFDPSHPMLCDARGITDIEASFIAMFTRVTRLAPELSRFRAPVISAILVNSQTVFGYVRMLEQILDLTSFIKIHAVWTEEEALALVGHSGTRFADLFQP